MNIEAQCLLEDADNPAAHAGQLPTYLGTYVVERSSLPHSPISAALLQGQARQQAKIGDSMRCFLGH